jgi:hypothetical protein
MKHDQRQSRRHSKNTNGTNLRDVVHKSPGGALFNQEFMLVLAAENEHRLHVVQHGNVGQRGRCA